MTADYSRTCAGCECITEEAFTIKAEKEGICYRCDSPEAGSWRGRVIGLDRLEPYIPAWCPKLSKEEINGNGADKYF